MMLSDLSRYVVLSTCVRVVDGALLWLRLLPWQCNGVLAIDQRVVFTGSANFTNKSHRNAELHLRLVGPPAPPIVCMAESARFHGRLLKEGD